MKEEGEHSVVMLSWRAWLCYIEGGVAVINLKFYEHVKY